VALLRLSFGGIL